MNIRQYKRFCRSLKDLRFSFCHQISIQIPKLHLPDSQPAYNASCVAFLTVFQLFAGKFSLLFWDRNLYRFQSQLFIPPWRCALNFNRVFTWTTTDYHRAPTDSMAFLLYSVSWLAHRVECAVRKKKLMALLFLLLDFWIHVPTVATAKAYWSFCFSIKYFSFIKFSIYKNVHSFARAICIRCEFVMCWLLLLQLFPVFPASSLFFLVSRFPLPCIFPLWL